MKLLPFHRPSGKSASHRHYLPENAVFWMVLLLLSIGSVTSLYEKSSHPASASGASYERTLHEAGAVYRVKNRELPIYCVQTDKPLVALSFDAAWGNESTGKILDILDKYEIKTTFFMTGTWVEAYPDDVKLIASKGHDLGNHSENHKNMSQLNESQMQSEIRLVHDRVKNLTGNSMELFRPPYGDYNNQLITTADDLGYYPISWDVDSLDWKDYGADSIADKVLNHPHLGNGSIILLHNGAKYTPDALETIITGLQSKGYSIVPVSEIILKENFHLDAEGRQIPDQENS